jgi:phage shock protein C
MKKKLYRNTEEKLVAGVLAGLADYSEQDVVFYRLVFIAFLILTGFMPGILIYILAMVITPGKPKVEPLHKSEYTVYK